MKHPDPETILTWFRVSDYSSTIVESLRAADTGLADGSCRLLLFQSVCHVQVLELPMRFIHKRIPVGRKAGIHSAEGQHPDEIGGRDGAQGFALTRDDIEGINSHHSLGCGVQDELSHRRAKAGPVAGPAPSRKGGTWAFTCTCWSSWTVRLGLLGMQSNPRHLYNATGRKTGAKQKQHGTRVRPHQ